jgi:hypothetical protein
MTSQLNPGTPGLPFRDAELTSIVTENAIDAAAEHAPPDFLEQAYQALKRVAERQLKLTADDVWEELERVPDAEAVQAKNNSAMGPVFRRAARDRVIFLVQGEGRTSERPSTHGRMLRVWQSIIFED